MVKTPFQKSIASIIITSILTHTFVFLHVTTYYPHIMCDFRLKPGTRNLSTEPSLVWNYLLKNYAVNVYVTVYTFILLIFKHILFVFPKWAPSLEAQFIVNLLKKYSLLRKNCKPIKLNQFGMKVKQLFIQILCQKLVPADFLTSYNVTFI